MTDPNYKKDDIWCYGKPSVYSIYEVICAPDNYDNSVRVYHTESEEESWPEVVTDICKRFQDVVEIKAYE